MTLDKTRELLAIQADHRGFNCSAAKLILSEVQKGRGQAAVDRLIRNLRQDRIFDFKTSTHFDGGLAK